MLLALAFVLAQSPLDLTPTDDYVQAYRECVLSESLTLDAEGPEVVEVTVSRAADRCVNQLAAFEDVASKTLRQSMAQRSAESMARQMRDAARDSAARAARQHLILEKIS